MSQDTQIQAVEKLIGPLLHAHFFHYPVKSAVYFDAFFDTKAIIRIQIYLDIINGFNFDRNQEDIVL